MAGFEIGERLSADFVAAAHAHGMPVYSYTINEEPALRQLVGMGVDGIETDVPELLARVVDGSPRAAAARP